MLMKMLRPAILIMFALAPCAIAQAADAKIDCRLRGGSVVQLSADACVVEGGLPANAGAPPAPVIAPGPNRARGPVDPKLAAAQKAVVELLDKPVTDTTPLKQRPEGIERTALFDGCKLMVEENLHIDLGNLIPTRKDFRVSSVIDLKKLERKEFGVLPELESKGGGLKAAAVYFEEDRRKDSSGLSISVLYAKDGSLQKYRAHTLSAYLETRKDDFWIADEYGYPKDGGMGAVASVATDMVRILLIVGSADEAEKLKAALEDVHAMCKAQ